MAAQSETKRHNNHRPEVDDMNRDELKKLIVGPVAPVPTPFDDDFEVDFGLMADLTEWWVECGAVAGKAVIKIAAQAGEGDKLRDWEGPALLRTAVQAARARRP